MKRFSERNTDKMSAVKNNFYMLKHMFKASPLGVALSFLYFFFWRGIGLFYSIVLMRALMQALETGADFIGVVKLLLVMLAVSAVDGIFESWFTDLYAPKMFVTFQEYFMTLIYKQAVSCDLACYENPPTQSLYREYRV